MKRCAKQLEKELEKRIGMFLVAAMAVVCARVGMWTGSDTHTIALKGGEQ